MKRHLLTAIGLLLFAPTVSAIIDTNNNGLSDLWERTYNNDELFAESFNPQADADADGWTNAQEAAAGTNPFDPNPDDGLLCPEATHIPAAYGPPDGNGLSELITPEAVTVIWPTLVGKQYTLLFSPDLSTGSWMPVGVPNIGNGNDFVYGFEISDAGNCFWRVAVCDVDTNGDGFTDHEEYGLGINAASAYRDSDNDGFSDAVEKQMGTDPNNQDSDGDTRLDGEDSVPTDAAIWWPATPSPRYALVETGIANTNADGTTATLIDINRSGEILFRKTHIGSRDTCFVWDPSTNATRDATPPASFANVNITGTVDSRLAADGSHHATLVNQQNAMSSAARQGNPAWLQHFQGTWNPPAPSNSQIVDAVDGQSLAVGDGNQYKLITFDSQSATWSASVQGTHAAGFPPLSANAQGDLLFNNRVERPNLASIGTTGTPFASSCRLGLVIVPDPTPAEPNRTRSINVVTSDSGMWVETPDGLTMKAATCSTLPAQGRIAENGTAIGNLAGVGGGVWMNGKTHALYGLLSPAGWNNACPAGIATNGLLSANAKRQSTGGEETVLLVPISADALPPPLTEEDTYDNTPDDPECLALGVDRVSMLASGGSAKTHELWIMAPIGGASTGVHIRSGTNARNTMKLTGGSKVEFTPDTLNSGAANIQVAGMGTTTMDVSVPLTLSGNPVASNRPIKVKAMKKRTVKVALHDVRTSDQGLYLPEPDQLAIYLNKVYGPQVNVHFEVIPFVEAGPDGNGIDLDLGESNVLYMSNSTKVAAATPNAKAGVPGSDFNIDVWVIGGEVSLLAPYKIGYGREYGQRLPGKPGVIIDGDMAGLDAVVPDGRKRHHIHNTIAHEIGHVMAGNWHPGNPNYPSGLQWEDGSDPYLTKRLMCSGLQANHAHPGACLIKKEWDSIEAWLHSNIDPPPTP